MSAPAGAAAGVPATPPRAGSFRAGEAALVAIVWLAALLPFVGRAFNVDEPLFLWTAQHVADHPLDFFGFDVNWRGSPIPMHEVSQNPPLGGYWLVPAGVLSGWSEVALHLWMLVPALALGLGTYALAARFTRRPLVAAIACLAMPAVLVSSTTVMCDVPMAALWVGAVVLWDRGLVERRAGALAAAAVCAGLALLTKYSAGGLVPLLLVHGLARRRALGAWVAWLAVPLALLGAYELWTAHLYGAGHFAATAGFASDVEVERGLAARFVSGLSFTGACCAALLFLAPFVAGARSAVPFAALGGGVLAWLLHDPAAVQAAFAMPAQLETHGAAQTALWAAVGAAVVGLAVRDAVVTRSAEGLVLALWVVGVFVTAAGVKWWSDGRGILPLAPAVAVLAARALDRRAPAQAPALPPRVATALAAALALALVVTWADARVAGSARAAARGLVADANAEARLEGVERAVRFQGHWGFQYYAERLGALAMDLDRLRFDAGDAILLPGNNSAVLGLGPAQAKVEVVGKREFPVPGWVTTMNPASCAGFHSALWGPLPFAFGPLRRPEAYLVLEAQSDHP